MRFFPHILQSHADRLAVHLERLRYIPETVVKFWMAELSSALEYLHRQRIIHRYVHPQRRCGPPSDVLVPRVAPCLPQRFETR